MTHKTKQRYALVIDVFETAKAPEFKVNEVDSLIGNSLVYPPDLIQLILHTAEYYASTYSQVLDASLSISFLPDLKVYYRLSARILALFNAKNNIKDKSGKLSLKKQTNSVDYVNEEISSGNLTKNICLESQDSSENKENREISLDQSLKNLYKTQYSKDQAGLDKPLEQTKQVTVSSELDSLMENQYKILELIYNSRSKKLRDDRLNQLVTFKKNTLKKHLKALLERGMIVSEYSSSDEISLKSEGTSMIGKLAPADKNIRVKHGLNTDQKQALELIRNSDKRINKFVLHGITGSGKTEVYIHLLEEMLAAGKSSIVLIPEISLAPQLIQRLNQYFKSEDLLVWHSALSKAEKRYTFNMLLSGAPKIVVGARSAIFAPCHQLGLIVVDEEHENSYKQNEPEPRYHGVQLALERASSAGARLILASATPSIETYFKAINSNHPDYQLIELKNRTNLKSLPDIEIVDMREEFKNNNKSIFSAELRNLINQKLESKEQIILFLNKRGDSTHVFCRTCGFVYNCPNCTSKIVYHSDKQTMLCHFCGYREPHPRSCPMCGEHTIKYFGLGTQKLASEVSKEFSTAKVSRMDSDTMTNNQSYIKLWQDFAAQDIDILVGTQMIAKGLDNPNLTLVGVVAADSNFNQLDYTSEEKAFQLLTQVAGRAGRAAKTGQVVFQTYQPDRETIKFASKHDYNNFFNYEIENRADYNYPPFSKLIRFIVLGLDEKAVIDNINRLHRNLCTKLAVPENIEIEVLGPSPCQLARINKKYRYHILIKLILNQEYYQFEIKKIYYNFSSDNNTNLIIDVDNSSLY